MSININAAIKSLCVFEARRRVIDDLRRAGHKLSAFTGRDLNALTVKYLMAHSDEVVRDVIVKYASAINGWNKRRKQRQGE